MTARASPDPIDVHSAFDRHIEIIATFFTARYYNEIYNLAQDMFAKKGGRSLTETYASVLCEYLRSLERPDGDGVIPTIHALHEYSDKYCGRTTLNEFIARIISQIAPEEYYTTIGTQDRDAILRGLVSQVALTIGKRALEPDMMRMIIDNRSNHVGVGILRTVGARVLRDFKASFLSKLYGDKVAHQGRVVSSEIYNKMRNEFRATLTQLVGTQIDEMRAKNELAQRVREIEVLRARIAELERQLVDARAKEQSARARHESQPFVPSIPTSHQLAQVQTFVPALAPAPVPAPVPVPVPVPAPVLIAQPEPTRMVDDEDEPEAHQEQQSAPDTYYGSSDPETDEDCANAEDIARAIAEANKKRSKTD
jgi:polyhydroxyalkanoate synthesis regulator phasin